jgi:hypothetical protein
MIPRYLILFASVGIPGLLVGQSPLIPEKELIKVRKHFEEDWNRCLEYASEANSSFIRSDPMKSL